MGVSIRDATAGRSTRWPDPQNGRVVHDISHPRIRLAAPLDSNTGAHGFDIPHPQTREPHPLPRHLAWPAREAAPPDAMARTPGFEEPHPRPRSRARAIAHRAPLIRRPRRGRHESPHPRIRSPPPLSVIRGAPCSRCDRSRVPPAATGAACIFQRCFRTDSGLGADLFARMCVPRRNDAALDTETVR